MTTSTFDATVAFLNASLTGHPGEVILAPKDIGFYFQGRHYGMEDVGDVGSIPDAAKRALRGDRSLREIKHIGAFVVYENPGYNGA